MKAKISKLLLIFIPLILLSQAGCNVKLHRNKNIKEEVKVTTIVDSSKYDSLNLALRRMNSIVDSLRKTKIENTHSSTNQTHDVSYDKETITNPYTVKGETFVTTIDANWVLDSTAIRSGKLVYFDMDNPTLKAKIYADSLTGKMKIEIQTKDKVVDIPVEKVSFKSKKELKVDSNKTVTEDEKRGTLQISTTDSNVKQIEISNTYQEVDSAVNKDTVIETSWKSKLLQNWWVLVLIVALVAFIVLNFKFCWIEKLCN